MDNPRMITKILEKYSQSGPSVHGVRWSFREKPQLLQFLSNFNAAVLTIKSSTVLIATKSFKISQMLKCAPKFSSSTYAIKYSEIFSLHALTQNSKNNYFKYIQTNMLHWKFVNLLRYQHCTNYCAQEYIQIWFLCAFYGSIWLKCVALR